MPRHGMTAPGMAVPGSGGISRRRGLTGWPIRRKLVALVAGPLLVVLAGGAYVTTQAVQQLRQAQDAQKVATATLQSNRLSQALETEFLSSLNLYNSPSTSNTTRHNNAVAGTDQAFDSLATAVASPPHAGWDADIRTLIKGVQQSHTKLKALRQHLPKGSTASAATGDLSTLQLEFVDIFDQPRTLTQQLANAMAGTTSDGRAVNAATVIFALSQATSEAASEIANVNIALTSTSKSPSLAADLQNTKIRQQDLLSLAQVHATPDEQKAIAALNQDDSILSLRNEALAAVTTGQSTGTGKGDAVLFTIGAGQRLGSLDALVNRVTGDAQTRASQDEHDALVRLGLVGLGALLLILIVTIFAAAVARSVSMPLRRLRSAAAETANVRLPAAVQQIEHEGPEAAVVLQPALPPGHEGGPEAAEVARAFDGLTGEAVRLAAAQVRLRRSLDDAFVSMSRRSQSMVEKQLAIIDELERTEEDPEQLRNLFRLDHLAARMRRYNDNLLVLAGSVVRTRSNAPVPIADVFRAATSEMEQYERVRLQPVSGAAVAGPAAGGLIHLLAELLDNAAMYSPPTSPILMAAEFTPEDGLRLEVTDSGVGVPASELAEVNSRLASPGSFDMQVPSRMGLYVVARLAQRGGFSVQLAQRAGAAGTIAEVIVPPQLVVGSAAPSLETSGAPGSLQPAGTSPSLHGVTALRALPVGPAPHSPADGITLPAASDAERDDDADAEQGEPAEAATWGGPRRLPDAPAAVPAPDSLSPSAPEAEDDEERTTRLPARNRAEAPPSAQPAAAAAQPDEPVRPLPSRRPGASLASGPLAGAAGAGARAAAASGPSPFAPAATSPASAPERLTTAGAEDTGSNGANGTGAAARAGGGFGTPGRPFTAGTPTPGRRASGTGGPSAATAAAAAAAARAARHGGQSTTASALFAARGPATDAGAAPVEGSADTGNASPDDVPTGGGPVARSDAPDATTGSVSGPPESPAAPAAWDNGPAVEAARRSGNGAPDAIPEPVLSRDAATPVSLPVADILSGQDQDADQGSEGSQPAAPEPVTADDDFPAASPGILMDTPIFDTVSMWFSPESGTGEVERVIDLRDGPDTRSRSRATSRWSSLGDQRWMATNARAAAEPEVAGTTEVGLPRRRPGANLIPSAAAAAPLGAPATRTSPATRTDAPPRGSQAAGVLAGWPTDPAGRADADAIRGRLSSYQRGLTSARRARHLPADRPGDGLFTAPRNGENDSGHTPGEQGG